MKNIKLKNEKRKTHLKKPKGITLYLSSFFAALTCPCHVPIYLFIFSGTSAGVFLAENEWIFFIALGISFPIFILLAFMSYYRIKAQYLSQN